MVMLELPAQRCSICLQCINGARGLLQGVAAGRVWILFAGERLANPVARRPAGMSGHNRQDLRTGGSHGGDSDGIPLGDAGIVQQDADDSMIAVVQEPVELVAIGPSGRGWCHPPGAAPPARSVWHARRVGGLGV